ncbi:tudor domain-containing 6 [Chaetodon auriga]|uniref:tudor domain-containing 6 n=1 Tax=Chaetodon auriga TaxID=39042 RepID=UPI0040328DA6
MCSIPGLPTPGSEVPVLITRINLNPNCGLVELWVNIVDGRKHMRDDIQIPTKKFCGSEGKPGDLCLVCLSDTWHRARILSIQSEIYNVFLIDQKLPHVTTSEALAWDKDDSFLLPPETESCILANVLSIETNWPESTTKFLKSLPGKKFKGLVQHVLMPDRIILLDIPIVSKQICMCGVAKKIPADEFKCLVLKCLHLPKEKYPENYHIMQEHSLNVNCLLEKHDQYFYPELFTDTFETVNVTEVISPQKIFCKLLIFSKAVKLLSEQIHQHYEESSDLGEVRPQTCGDPCAARGINGRWHRSLLKQDMTSDGAIEVLHVDEGKTELVPVGNIKPLHGKFLRMPVFTYPCSLDGAIDNEWTTEQTDYFKLLLLHQTVVVRFVHHNIPEDVYYVTLSAASAPFLNNYCAEMAGRFPPSKTEQDSNVQNEPIPSPVLSSVGDKRRMDVQNNVNGINVDGLQEESLANTKSLAVDGRTDDVPTSSSDEIHIKDGSEHPNHLAQNNGHRSTGLPSLLQNACDDDVFTVGSTVNVNISCIESLQKFWCQTTENADSLRLLMQDLQNYYAPAYPRPLVESVCVARNPNNGMWYRARIIANHHSPVVDVRFIDYGQIQKVPLRDVRPIDPVFLRLNAQAFQCCLFNLENRTNPTAIAWTDAALTEFQRFVDLGSPSNIGLKCTVKAVMSDEEGLRLNMVDIVTPSDSTCKLLGQRCAQDESYVHIPLQVPSDSYNYSTHNIEVGGKEKVWVTSSENVNHFYCQLDRNSHLFEKVMENVHQHIGQPQCTVHSLGLNSICFARYSDNHWYRAEVVEMSPKLTVNFVDYGHTLVVNESDICPFPTEASIARSVPVQAIPLGLFDVPEQVPQEVNQWFADNAINCSLTISVVAKGAKGKLIVELFDGTVNVNAKVRERISQMTQQKMTGLAQQTDEQLSKHASVPNEDCLMRENMSVLMKMTEENNVHTRNGMCDRAEHKMSSQSINDVSAPEIRHEETLNEGRKPTLDVTLEDREIVSAEMFIGGGDSNSDMTQLSLPSCLEGDLKICIYKKPNISLNKTEEVYASCIVGPCYFWCQYANTEELDKVSRLAQEAGQAQQDIMFAKTLGPGSPCLALFSSDNQWHRAQVIHNTENTLNVVFIDYGNEYDVDIENVRPLPQCLLEKAPQAFLCSLIGFDKSKGSWDDNVNDDFYNLLVDKPLKVIVFNMEDHPVIAVPQYAVQLECDNMVVNDTVLKYWKPVANEHVVTENPQTENLLHSGEIKSNMTDVNVSKGSVTTSMYKNPNISKNKKEEVYASCIVEPHFFWCQYANTEELNKVSRLAQEAGQAQQDAMFPETLGPGSPCLALFSSDKQWYRAQVMHRAGNAFHVVFIDYGNESDVDIKDVRSLPQSLLEKAPQAFFCCLNGFGESRGSWVDEVYEDFHNLLVDKPLKLTVFNMVDHSEIAVPQYAVEIECEGVVVNAAMQKYWKPVAKEHVSIDSPQTETFLQDCQTESNMTHLSVSEGNMNTGMYTEPKISKNKTEMVYASCIVEPHFFWCQYANTEELNRVSRLAQETGQAQQDITFPETLGAGSPCLALFSSDKQWYRAQVIYKADNAFHVVFIDYGNESDVDIENVRPLPQSLLEKAPQAFLCSLSGFIESRGSWVDEVYEDFYNLLVDKPLKLTVFNMVDHPEIAVPQYAVQIECEGVVVNRLMKKYWKGLDTDHALAESVASG